MDIGTDFWGFWFGITLFVLFIYKIIDLIRIYVVPMLFQKMQEQRDRQTEVLEKEDLLSSTRKKIEKKIFEQKRHFVVLENNMSNLRDYMLQKQEAASKEQIITSKVLQQRRALQRSRQKQHVLLDAAIPGILAQAETELRAMAKQSSNKGFLLQLSAKK